MDNGLALIENQLERTDHNHLGQILTYAAGLQASYVIWVAQEFTDEHRGALDWLNQSTDSRFHFFGVEVELWKIGGSLPAPRFNVVVKPNEWVRNAAKAAQSIAEGEVSEAGQKRFSYWSALKEYLETHRTPARLAKPTYDSNAFFKLYGDVELKSYISKKGVGAYARIKGENRFSIFEDLMNCKEDIEEAFGSSLTWEREASWNSACCLITCSIKADTSDPNDWPRQHQFLADSL